MKELLTQINSSLLHLIGYSIEALPGIVFAIVILLITRFAANVTRKMSRAAGKRMLKSESLRSRCEGQERRLNN